MYLNQMKYPYLVVLAVIVIAVLALFIDSKVTGKEVKKHDYIKFALWSGVISTVLVYFSVTPGHKEDIIKGAPPF